MKVFIIDPYTLNIHVFIQKIYSLRTFQHDLCGYVLEYVYTFSFRCRSFEYRTDLQKKKRTPTHTFVGFIKARFRCKLTFFLRCQKSNHREFRLYNDDVGLERRKHSDSNQSFFSIPGRPHFQSYIIIYIHTNLHTHTHTFIKSVRSAQTWQVTVLWFGY